jgi:NTE family protein
MPGMTESFAIVLAGGGERVIPLHISALDRLARAGYDPGAATAVVGTSAGAFVAARLTTGLPLAAPPLRSTRPASFARLAALWSSIDGSPADRRRHLGALALRHRGDPDALVARVRAHLPDAPWPAPLRIVTIDAASGERVALTAASGVPLARAVAASRAIPTVDPPVAVAGRRCIDGALGSATNADLVPAADAAAVFISTGLSDPPIAGTPEPLWAQALAREVRELEAAGRRVVVMGPTGPGVAAA